MKEPQENPLNYKASRAFFLSQRFRREGCWTASCRWSAASPGIFAQKWLPGYQASLTCHWGAPGYTSSFPFMALKIGASCLYESASGADLEAPCIKVVALRRHGMCCARPTRVWQVQSAFLGEPVTDFACLRAGGAGPRQQMSPPGRAKNIMSLTSALHAWIRQLQYF